MILYHSFGRAQDDRHTKVETFRQLFLQHSDRKWRFLVVGFAQTQPVRNEAGGRDRLCEEKKNNMKLRIRLV